FLERGVLPGRIQHEKSAAAGADDFAAQDVETIADVIVDLVDARERDLVRQPLLGLPVLVEKLSPAIEVAALNGFENPVAEVLDAMETVGDAGVIDAVLALHGQILIGQHFASI